MFKTVLVCLDGSSLAEQVVQYAANIARRYSSRVVLLQVIPSSVAITPGVSVQTSLSVERSALEYLQRVASSMDKGRGPVECVTAQGSPGEAIVRYAKENKVDLIAMSTNGRGGLGQTLFGSVAQHVLREAGLPILLVRPKGA